MSKGHSALYLHTHLQKLKKKFQNTQTEVYIVTRTPILTTSLLFFKYSINHGKSTILNTFVKKWLLLPSIVCVNRYVNRHIRIICFKQREVDIVTRSPILTTSLLSQDLINHGNSAITGCFTRDVKSNTESFRFIASVTIH